MRGAVIKCFAVLVSVASQAGVRRAPPPADDQDVGKYVIFLVALLLAGTASCYDRDVEATLGGLPVVGAIVVPKPAPPAYIATIGTPAANTLPETDVAAWFADEPEADAYDVARWREVTAFVAVMGTPGGFTEACHAVNGAAGSDRAANAKLGALACSSDGSVTQLQQFAAGLLALQGEVALWYRGAPGSSIAAVHARQAAVRLSCDVGLAGRQGLDSAFAGACAAVDPPVSTSSDLPAVFAAIAAAYDAVAAAIAELDPEIDPDPGFFLPPQ